MNDETTRVRWRITLDQLCHVARTSASELEQWAQIGAFGPRWRERRDRGKWRHIDRTTADRAVLMRRLVDAGFREDAAAAAVQTHKHGPTTELVHLYAGVELRVSRENLP